jgi:excisionase family DNA binding protein
MELLTIVEAARFMKMKESTLYKYTCQRRIPYFKLIGQVRFDKNQLERWIASHAVQSIVPKIIIQSSTIGSESK